MSTIVEPTKKAFLTTWPGGYRENWVVYGKTSGVKEEVVVEKCLCPFYKPTGTALEIGCGLGFWTEGYLSRNFKRVIALDLLPPPMFVGTNIEYIEVPDRNYECYGVTDESVDFVWSFGVFVHLTLPSIQKYVSSAFKKLKKGGKAALNFSNKDRRPMVASISNTEDQIIWADNDLAQSQKMMEVAGFTQIYDLMPELHDTMLCGTKL